MSGVAAGAPTEPAAVRARGLRKSFGAQTALDGVDLDLPAGTFLTLVGPNGAGKTTLLRMLAGLSRPSGGELRVLGVIPGPSSAALRARIGLVSHESQLYGDLSADENLRFFAALYGVPDPESRIDAALGQVELRSRRADPVRVFSRGMTQRLSIARALLHEPSLLLFDEPTTGLDDRAVGILIDLLAALHGGGRTLILTTHRLDVGLRVADRVAVQARGRIVHEAAAGSIDPATFAGLYAALTEGRA